MQKIVNKIPQRLCSRDYQHDAVTLAQQLLGQFLCRRIGNKIIKRQITETEAYYGEGDTACHAHKGKTERTKIMYYAGGYAYIYLCYGVHWMFNVVTGKADFPEAVLIRGIDGFNGPGKLTKYLKIDKTLNGENLVESTTLWIEDGVPRSRPAYTRGKRIGIDYAVEEDKNKLWRFTIK
ncbi:putative 3-methyladenine DNA glycosylase [Spirochaetia bacterium]|nr:putative 3-methyladenine DNA glycosylase [Spirochaetia bacterium]